MDTALVIVGTGKWYEYTWPLLRSIEAHDPELRVVVVNNGNCRDYEIPKWMTEVTTHKVECYSRALNLGMAWAMQVYDPDWFIPMNNDVIVTKKFSHKMKELDISNLYGFYIHMIGNQPYLSGWALLVSRPCWNDVGNFDEYFKPMYYEDADFSIRAVKAGYKLVNINREEFGLYHLEGERHKERKDEIVSHQLTRKLLREYLRKKHGF